MTALSKELDRLIAADAEAGLLTGPTGIDDEKTAIEAATLAKPLIVNAFADWAIDAGANLVNFLQTASANDRRADKYEPARRLFGKRLVPATNAVRVEAGISADSAASILDAISAHSTAALAERANADGLDKKSLADLLRNERATLIDDDWGPWIELVGRGDHLAEPNTVSTPMNTTDNLALGSAAADAGHDEMPEQREAKPLTSAPVAEVETEVGDEVENDAEVDDVSAAVDADSASRSRGDDAASKPPTADVPRTGSGPFRGDRWDALAGNAVEEQPVTESDDRLPKSVIGEEPSSKRAPVLIGALGAAALVGGGLFALLSSGGDTDTALSDETSATTDQADDTITSDPSSETEAGEADPTPVVDDTTADEGNGSPLPAAEDGIVRLELPLDDPKGETDMVGSVELEFNIETGEICYVFTADDLGSPFPAHIRVGAAGIRGGAVVDFELNESGVGRCVANPPADTNDILAFPASYYAEAHDPDFAYSIRAQLSDETAAYDGHELAFADPDGGGAQAVVEAGTIVLRGPIADRVTGDLLAAEYAALDLAGIEVIDEMEVTSDAPPPSGRVTLNDAILFPVGSADLSGVDQRVLDVLVAVALSEPDSTMTIVGHTDSTGNQVANLNLSLDRANALRDVLVNAGVPLDRLRVEGAGDTDPIGDNATAEGRGLNRRIEFELKPVVS